MGMQQRSWGEDCQRSTAHTKGSTSMKLRRTRILGNPAWWAEAHKVTQIPIDQLPEGGQRDTLVALALLGEAEVYTPIGSDRWNIWFEQPIRERLTIADWLARTDRKSTRLNPSH